MFHVCSSFLLLDLSHFASRELARAVSKIIALALDLDINFFDKPEMLGEPIATLRLLHYDGKVSFTSFTN